MNPLNPKTYDRLKFLALVVLPALATLYFALAGIWHLPAAEQIIGTIAAIDTFLGAVLHLSSNSYKTSDARFGGEIQVGRTPSGGKSYTLALNDDPQDLDERGEVTFKIVRPTTSGLVFEGRPATVAPPSPPGSGEPPPPPPAAVSPAPPHHA
jgi:hypothetical protein